MCKRHSLISNFFGPLRIFDGANPNTSAISVTLSTGAIPRRRPS
jgi:hypothetical protein